MKIYAAGWALQSPALNYFKKFLHANDIALSGIIYPKRIPEDLEGVAILEFDEAREQLTRDDTIILCHRPGVTDQRLSADLRAFFESLGLSTLTVSEFLLSLVEQDQQNRLRFPAAGVTSADIRELRAEKALSFLEDGFADLASYATACRLEAVAKTADWDQMLPFDQDSTPDEVIYELIADLHARGVCQNFHVLDTPQVFLNAVLKLKALNPTASLSVALAPAAANALGPRLAFYQRALSCTASLPAREGVTYLAGSAAAIAERLQQDTARANAIFLMPRSIFDYRTLRGALGAVPHRILLRQADTVPGHLIGACLT